MATPGAHFPRSDREFRAWFQDDNACLDYLDWLRWGNQLVCTSCGSINDPRQVDGRVWRCAACTAKVSRTAGTIFQDTRTPMTSWFAAAWELCMDKGGVSALTIQRRLELGSYQTAWMMLHRFRSAMALAGRDKLQGEVEVDETFLGGVRSGGRGRGALGKVIVVIAIERKQPKGYGRVRLRIIPDATAKTLTKFLDETIERGATVVTDGWLPYQKATAGRFTHVVHRIAPSGQQAHTLLPGVHRVAALLKRWILGTYQGSYHADHLAEYLDEFTFRFNRRRSPDRGLLFYRLMTMAAQAQPLTYNDVVKNPTQKSATPVPPSGRRSTPRSLSLPKPAKPWRAVSPSP